MHFRIVRSLASVLLIASMVFGVTVAFAAESTEKLIGLGTGVFVVAFMNFLRISWRIRKMHSLLRMPLAIRCE